MELESILSSISCCFVCGVNINDDDDRSGYAGGKNGNLKDLVRLLCELLSVEITCEDGEFLDGLENQESICCCGKCYDLLKNVDRMQEIILRTQEQLEVYLEEVESLIVSSELEQHVQMSSEWSQRIRRSILKNVKPDSKYDEHEDSGTENNWNKMQRVDSSGQEVQKRMINISDKITIRRIEDVDNISAKVSGNPTDIPTSATITLIKRKLADVTAETNEVDEMSEYPSSKRRCISARPSRECKKKAEVAIRYQSQSTLTDGEDDESRDTRSLDDSEDNYEDNWNSQTETRDEDDNNDDNDSSDKDEEDDDGDGDNESMNTIQSKPTKFSKADDDEDDKESAPFGRTCKGAIRKRPVKLQFFPFLIGEENLYLYRLDTFVHKTFTHLKCRAYQCNFQTAFDFYPSFQRMKSHLEKCHRNRKHRQRTPHPCLLCMLLFRNREDFWKHLKATHTNKFFQSVEAICESCLAPKPHRALRVHHFSHKNEEEKAAARAMNDGPARCFQPKEREIMERNFICDYEDCKMAFKNSSNLRRHKQTHLPKELRTDQALCPDCGKYILKEDFAVHVQKFHHPELVDRVLLCTFCDKRYHPDDKSSFDTHIRRHKGEKPFLCTEGGASFFDRGALSTHINQIHKNNDPIPCQWCGQIYTKKTSLRQHMIRHHPDKFTPQPLKERMSKFYYKEAVKGDFIGPIQQFPCTVCDVVCKYRFTLRKHMANIHNIGHSKWR